MNTRSIGLWIALGTAIVLTLSLALGSVRAEDDWPECPVCADFDLAAYDGPLAEDEVMGLLRALNDEYHAWAVYDQVIADHGEQRPFTSILRSEQTHIDLLLPLLDRYAVAPVPANPWPGAVPSFASLSAACAAGAEAEIVNVALYDRLFASTEREDLLATYETLRRASQENHLPAFQRCAEGGEPGGGGPGGGPAVGPVTPHPMVYLPVIDR